MAAAISNLILYVTGILSNQQIRFDLLFLITGLLPLAMTVFLFYSYRKISSNIRISHLEEASGHQPKPLEFWQLFPFIFAISAVGGLMYAVVGTLSTPTSGVLNYFSLVPYIIFLFIAGFLADRVGRRINAVVGAIAAGVGFMSVGLFTDLFSLF
jgi:uncharacterized oligopeptide transporter (OPT) family protein